MHEPIWPTFDYLGIGLNEDSLLDYTKNISSNAYTHAYVQLDNRWQSHYGDLSLDGMKFTDPIGLASQLKEYSFRANMWSHLFVNTDAIVFTNVTTSALVVRDTQNTMKIITWDYGYGVSVDATNANARQWSASPDF
ncbi:unnamed protein product [Sphagnum balticum]